MINFAADSTSLLQLHALYASHVYMCLQYPRQMNAAVQSSPSFEGPAGLTDQASASRAHASWTFFRRVHVDVIGQVAGAPLPFPSPW